MSITPQSIADTFRNLATQRLAAAYQAAADAHEAREVAYQAEIEAANRFTKEYRAASAVKHHFARNARLLRVAEVEEKALRKAESAYRVASHRHTKAVGIIKYLAGIVKEQG